MDEKGFDKLIARYQAGRATEKERALIEAWLEQRQLRDRFGDLSPGDRAQIQAKIFHVVSERVRGKKRQVLNKPFLFRAAAVLTFLAVLSYSLIRLLPAAPETIMMMHSVASAGGTKKIILDDNSIVWLKGNTSILYPEKFATNERHVRLAGEALFEVTKDAERPFIIECGGLVTKVLGTSFNIKSGETSTEVMVLTGEVSISSKKGTQQLVIKPNEKAIYDHVLERIDKVVVRDVEVTAKTSETQYRMEFNATRLEEIARRIEAKFDVRVSLSDPGLNNCTITADFTDQSLESTLTMIVQSLKIEYEMHNGHVIMTGEACEDRDIE